jgi:hypothetical protein
MQKIASTGIAPFLALLFVTFLATCDLERWNPAGAGEITDVVYTVSPDGKSAGLTLYFDGEGVPVTANERAMNLDLAKMAYECFEVVFEAANGNVARAAWELGSSAGISGVYRTDAGVDYQFDNSVYGTTPAATQGALLFTGTKTGTLLGVGRIIKVDGGAIIPKGAPVNITTATKSVTFELDALKARLVVSPTTLSSLLLMNESPNVNDSYTSYTNLPNCGVTINGVKYPLFAYSSGKYYRYAIWGGVTTYWSGIKFRDFTKYKDDIVKMRTPRYIKDGKYFYPKFNMSNSEMKLNLDYFTATTISDYFADDGPLRPLHLYNYQGADFNIPLVLEEAPGEVDCILSFCIEVPVYLMNKADAANYGPAAKTWYVRSGVARDLYSLDDGLGSGGCVMMVSDTSFSGWGKVWE